MGCADVVDPDFDRVGILLLCCVFIMSFLMESFEAPISSPSLLKLVVLYLDNPRIPMRLDIGKFPCSKKRRAPLHKTGRARNV